MIEVMRWVGVLILTGCSFALPDPGEPPDPDAPPSVPTQRIKLTFANAARGEVLDDFPVLVTLNPSRIDYAALQPDGAELRFADGDGTALPYDIARWVPGGHSTVWVRVPTIDATDSD